MFEFSKDFQKSVYPILQKLLPAGDPSVRCVGGALRNNLIKPYLPVKDIDIVLVNERFTEGGEFEQACNTLRDYLVNKLGVEVTGKLSVAWVDKNLTEDRKNELYSLSFSSSTSTSEFEDWLKGLKYLLPVGLAEGYGSNGAISVVFNLTDVKIEGKQVEYPIQVIVLLCGLTIAEYIQKFPLGVSQVSVWQGINGVLHIEATPLFELVHKGVADCFVAWGGRTQDTEYLQRIQGYYEDYRRNTDDLTERSVGYGASTPILRTPESFVKYLSDLNNMQQG